MGAWVLILWMHAGNIDLPPTTIVAEYTTAANCHAAGDATAKAWMHQHRDRPRARTFYTCSQK